MIEALPAAVISASVDAPPRVTTRSEQARASGMCGVNGSTIAGAARYAGLPRERTCHGGPRREPALRSVADRRARPAAPAAEAAAQPELSEAPAGNAGQAELTVEPAVPATDPNPNN